MSGPPSQPIGPGTQFPDGTRLSRPFGRGAISADFIGKHPQWGDILVRVLDPVAAEMLDAMEDEFLTLAGLEHRSVQRYVGSARHGDSVALYYEPVVGETLAETIARRDADGEPWGFRDAYNLIGHLSMAIEAMHAFAPHGTLDGTDVVVMSNGSVKLTNAGYGRLALVSLGVDHEEFAGSPFIAPEVREDPWALSETADYYALGVLFASVLACRMPTRDSLSMIVELAAEDYTPEVRELLGSLMAAETMMRLASPDELRSAMQSALRAVRIAGKSGEIGGPTKKEEAGPKKPDLFAGIDLPKMPGQDTGGPKRWLIRRDGRDYGPFNDQEIKDQLEADEIDENTDILDMNSQEMQRLIDIGTFTDYVMDYIPRREKRKLEQAERREEIVRDVKRGSITTIVTGGLAAVAGLVVLALTATAPLETDLSYAVARFPFVVPAPNIEYAPIEADQEMLASLFDLSEPAPEPEEVAAATNYRPSSSSSSSDDDEEFYDDDDYVVRFDSTAPTSRLDSGQINSTIASNFGSIRSCLEQEMRRNPQFAGVSVDFSIRPEGRVVDVGFRTRGGGSGMSTQGRQCMERTFRRIRFPQFNDVPMNVSFPFDVQ